MEPLARAKRRKDYPAIIINGVLLPQEYWSADIYGNTAIAKDGISYAHVDEEGVLSTGKVARAGHLSLEGKVLEYEAPRKDEQRIFADVYMEGGRFYIGKRPQEEEGLYPRSR